MNLGKMSTPYYKEKKLIIIPLNSKSVQLQIQTFQQSNVAPELNKFPTIEDIGVI